MIVIKMCLKSIKNYDRFNVLIFNGRFTMLDALDK